MKFNPRVPLALICVLFSLPILAQENEIGLNAGYGRTTEDEYNMKLVLPFAKYGGNFFRFGLCYYHRPKGAFFALKSGLDYDVKWSNDISLNYFRTPVGLDFIVGRKVHFIIGGGFFASYLFTFSKSLHNTEFEQSVNRFQIGWYANTGIGFQFLERYALRLNYQINADITKMCVEERHSPGGSPYQLNVKGYDGFIVLSLKYRLGKNQYPGNAGKSVLPTR